MYTLSEQLSRKMPSTGRHLCQRCLFRLNNVICSKGLSIGATLWICMYALIGGINCFAGPIIGTFVLMLIPQFFRSLKIYAPYISAGILIVIVYLMPQGLVGLPHLVRPWMARSREKKPDTHTV